MVHSEEKVHFAEESKKDVCIVDINHSASNIVKTSSTLPASTTVSSGQTTPWAGSRSALLGKGGPGLADSGPMEDVLLGNVAAAYRSPKDERTAFERIKHFYYKYIVVLNGVTVALAVVLFILLCILLSFYYRKNNLFSSTYIILISRNLSRKNRDPAIRYIYVGRRLWTCLANFSPCCPYE